MEHPEDYVREFERDFPEISFSYEQRMKLLALFEVACNTGAPTVRWLNETYENWL